MAKVGIKMAKIVKIRKYKSVKMLKLDTKWTQNALKVPKMTKKWKNTIKIGQNLYQNNNKSGLFMNIRNHWPFSSGKSSSFSGFCANK